MSDIRLYLLEVEKDKKEATSIAQGTAQRKNITSIGTKKLRLISNRFAEEGVETP
jgi:hypothetical protein